MGDTKTEQLLHGTLEGYEPEIGAALWRLQDARERTVRLLRETPEFLVNELIDGNSIGTILYHVALIEADWLYAEILEQQPPDDVTSLLPLDDRDAQGILTAFASEPLAAHLARLQAIRDRVLHSLRGMTAEDFHRPRHLPQYDVTPAWVLHHLAQHEAEHRAEIGAAAARVAR